MAHAGAQRDQLADRSPETRARVKQAAEWILANRRAAPHRSGGKVHHANTREVLAVLWGFNSGESLRRALATDRQRRTVTTWVNLRGLFAALYGRPENPREWTADDRATFQGWARWTFAGRADI